MSWPILASTACVVFCLAAFFYFHSYIKRRTGGEAVLAEIREEVNRLIMRIDEITEKDISLFEDKEKSLKALIGETDKRLKVYARELERREQSGHAFAALAAPKAVNETYTDLSPGPAPPERQPRFVQAERQIVPEPKPMGEQIRELARSGFSATVIASKLGISISEAELALALLERKPL
jgi:hypothetical protein